MPDLSSDEENMLLLLYKTVETLLYGSVASSLIFGSSLSLVWGMINTLQLISHTPLFMIPYTSKILLFLKSLFLLITFDPVNSESMLDTMFRVKGNEESYPSFNFRFDFLGHDNSNFIFLIGMPMLFLYVNLVLVVFYLLISRIKIAL